MQGLDHLRPQVEHLARGAHILQIVPHFLFGACQLSDPEALGECFEAIGVRLEEGDMEGAATALSDAAEEMREYVGDAAALLQVASERILFAQERGEPILLREQHADLLLLFRTTCRRPPKALLLLIELSAKRDFAAACRLERHLAVVQRELQRCTSCMRLAEGTRQRL